MTTKCNLKHKTRPQQLLYLQCLSDQGCAFLLKLNSAAFSSWRLWNAAGGNGLKTWTSSVTHFYVRKQHPAWTFLQGWLVMTFYRDANMTRKGTTSDWWVICGCLGDSSPNILHTFFDLAQWVKKVHWNWRHNFSVRNDRSIFSVSFRLIKQGRINITIVLHAALRYEK